MASVVRQIDQMQITMASTSGFRPARTKPAMTVGGITRNGRMRSNCQSVDRVPQGWIPDLIAVHEM